MQKPWSCDDSMGGNTIVREVEQRGGDRPAEQRAERPREQPAGPTEGDLRPRV